MNKLACLSFCHAIGIQDARIIDRDGALWANGTCPMKWHHERGDSHPSFGIKVSENGESFYYCFAHGAGSLPKLLHSLTWYYGYHFKDACQILSECENNSVDPTLPEFQEFEIEQDFSLPEIPKFIWDRFDLIESCSSEVLSFLHSRNARINDATFYDVRLWRGQYLLFPMTSAEGRLIAIQARRIWTKTLFFIKPEMCGEPELKFPKLKKTGAVFGGGKFHDSKHPVIVVESPLEALTVRNFGYPNVVATCMSVIPSQIEMLNYENMWLGFDSDKAGENSLKKFLAKKKNLCMLSSLDWKQAGETIDDPGKLRSRQDLIRVTTNRKLIFGKE